MIFTAVQIEEFSRRSSFFRLPGPYWTPTVADVAQLEDKLEGYLRSSGARQVNAVLADLDNSKRQYVGFSEPGRKMIWVNAFCSQGAARFGSWERMPLLIADGGPCYFQVSYDPTTGMFESLFINGPV